MGRARGQLVLLQSELELLILLNFLSPGALGAPLNEEEDETND